MKRALESAGPPVAEMKKKGREMRAEGRKMDESRNSLRIGASV